MLSLNSIAGWEDAVLASIAGARGTLEERDRQIERSGVYGEYPAIVRAYEELFGDPELAGEAIKRGVFLVWRGAMHLPADTGIAPLPDGTVREVIDAIDARARRGEIDGEQAWMLAWYHAQSPYLFELYGATPTLINLAQSCEGTAWRDAGITKQRMALRGQMGVTGVRWRQALREGACRRSRSGGWCGDLGATAPMAAGLYWTRARLEQICIEREDFCLHALLRIGRSGLKGCVALTITGHVEPPPSVIGSGASRFDLARKRTPFLFELEPSDHRYSSRVNRNILKIAP